MIVKAKYIGDTDDFLYNTIYNIELVNAGIADMIAIKVNNYAGIKLYTLEEFIHEWDFNYMNDILGKSYREAWNKLYKRISVNNDKDMVTYLHNIMKEISAEYNNMS